MSIISSNSVAPPPAAAGGSGGAGPTLSTISEMNSLRFDGGSYLSRTFGTPTDGSKYTISCWVKRSYLGSDQFITARLVSPYYDAGINFNTGNNIIIGDQNAGKINSSMVFRDTSSWYHIVSQRNDSNGNLVLWVNGVKIQETSATGASSYNSGGYNVVIGAINYNGYVHKFNGYLANIHFIDGQALDASQFAEEISGVWVPKAYDPATSGAYGTNGFHLDFADSGNIGNDVSGRGNHWTVN